jgi:hypothetical protein
LSGNSEDRTRTWAGEDGSLSDQQLENRSECHVVGEHRPGYIQISLSDAAQEIGEGVKDNTTGDQEGDSTTLVDTTPEEDSNLMLSPCTSYTGPNSNMQMYPREQKKEEVVQVERANVEEPNHRTDQGMTPSEEIAFAKINAFCANILTTLAPPLLKEIEGAAKLRAEAEPFTPKRMTRRAAAEAGGLDTVKAKKASAAETVLLHALGIVPSDLEVNDEDLLLFKQIFDSPLRDQHLRVVASIFGKIVPPSFARPTGCGVEVSTH